MEIEIQKMTKEHLEQIKDILQIEFDEFWNADVLDKELEIARKENSISVEDKIADIIDFINKTEEEEKGAE